MARRIDLIDQHRISISYIGGYRYANPQLSYQDSEIGKTKHRQMHWETLDETNKFISSLFPPIAIRM